MKVINIGNIADAFRFDDLPATGIVIEATPEELEWLPNLMYKEVTISATPRRQCDIGTPEEQCDRFANFCDSHSSCSQCPVKSLWNFANGHKPSCGILWAQMPYEEGGAK